MPITVGGVRSVDIEMTDPGEGRRVLCQDMDLTEVERSGSSFWFRGTGR